jgi:phenylalanine-4-hydroxylase
MPARIGYCFAVMFEIPGDCKLRGEYGGMAADWTVAQDYFRYDEAEQDRWRRLYRRQSRLVENYGAPVFLKALARLGMAEAIPDFGAVSTLLISATGWRLVAVPGLIPNDVFFDHLARRQFPVCRWLRREAELDYLVEPDVFHDFFGHVPMLLDPVFARFLEAYGLTGRQALATGGIDYLARLYWYMVEFGLIETPRGLRALGAGLLSSAGETVHCIDSPKPHRIGFEEMRVMRTHYRIDRYQATYFVLRDLDTLYPAIDRDLAPLFHALDQLPALEPTQILDTDRIYSRSDRAA